MTLEAEVKPPYEKINMNRNINNNHDKSDNTVKDADHQNHATHHKGPTDEPEQPRALRVAGAAAD